MIQTLFGMGTKRWTTTICFKDIFPLDDVKRSVKFPECRICAGTVAYTVVYVPVQTCSLQPCKPCKRTPTSNPRVFAGGYPARAQSLLHKSTRSCPASTQQVLKLPPFLKLTSTDRFRVGWLNGFSFREGYHESRRCSRDTVQESYITKYTHIRRYQSHISPSILVHEDKWSSQVFCTGSDTWLDMGRVGTDSSHRMYLLISFRKSTPQQNH